METPRRGLYLPDGTDPDSSDFADIDVLNANFSKIDEYLGSQLVSSTTRPNAPISGDVIYEVDTGYTFVWDGNAWVLPTPPVQWQQVYSNWEVTGVTSAMFAGAPSAAHWVWLGATVIPPKPYQRQIYIGLDQVGTVPAAHAFGVSTGFKTGSTEAEAMSPKSGQYFNTDQAATGAESTAIIYLENTHTASAGKQGFAAWHRMLPANMWGAVHGICRRTSGTTGGITFTNEYGGFLDIVATPVSGSGSF